MKAFVLKWSFKRYDRRFLSYSIYKHNHFLFACLFKCKYEKLIWLKSYSIYKLVIWTQQKNEILFSREYNDYIFFPCLTKINIEDCINKTQSFFSRNENLKFCFYNYEYYSVISLFMHCKLDATTVPKQG
jgi:hypothetical protein